MLWNYIKPTNCEEHKLKHGLPDLATFKENLEKYNTPNYLFTYSDGSGMTVLWGAEMDGVLKWFKNNMAPEINKTELDFMTAAGYSWPVDKYGNKL